MPGGRPKFEITPEVLKKTEKLAAQGLDKSQIARVLGICYQTLNEKTKEFSEFSEAIEEGKAKGVATITNALFVKAKGGDVNAQKYFLNNRNNENWKDKVVSEVDITSGGKTIKNDWHIHPVTTNKDGS
jgi:hypothetical protein